MEIISYFIRLPISPNRLERNIKNTIRYCSNFIHGLSFTNSKNDITFKLLKKTIDEFCSGILSNCHGGIIGYKGGSICKRILDSLNIPSINVEDVGIIDKISFIVTQYDAYKFNCGKHYKNLNCSMQQVYALARLIAEKQ